MGDAYTSNTILTACYVFSSKQTDGAGAEGGALNKASSPQHGPISPKEVEEASRILFAPAHKQLPPRPHPHAPAGGSVDGSYEDIGAEQLVDDYDGSGDASYSSSEAAAAVPLPMFRGRAARGAVGGLSSLASPAPRPAQQSQGAHSSSSLAPSSSVSSAASSSATARGSSRPASPPAPATTNPTTTTTSSLVGPLHPKPAVHAEILRFGMALAADPRIQGVIREELELRGGQQWARGLEDGESDEGEEAEEEGGVGGLGMESAVRRLCSGLAALEGEGGGGGMGEAAAGGRAFGGSVGSSFLTASYELVGLMGSGRGSEGQAGQEPVPVPGASFLSLGRSMRRRDCVAGLQAGGVGAGAQAEAGAGAVSEEVLDELLRSDDEDDAITQKMFASTPDEHVRRYLRNLDLECVICHEYMVEATAVDCGEGHCFCRECIARWLDEGAEERGAGRGGRGNTTKRCPTCQKAVGGCIPMRQYDAMIEKYVRASNLWDEITSYYRRKTLARMRRELEQEEQEREAERRRRREQGLAGRASEAFMNAFAGLGSLFGGGVGRGGREGEEAGIGGAATGIRRRRQRGRGARAGNATATEGGQQEGAGHERGRGEDRWWKSEVLQTALSVATMLILVVLFRRGVKIR